MIYAVTIAGTLSVPGSSQGVLDLGVPVPGAAEYLAGLKAAGHTVLLHDPLLNTDLGCRLAIDWLLQAGIDGYDDFWMKPGKPAADVYVDNRSERWPATPTNETQTAT